MALAKEPAPLSSQYPQLFDLQQIQHHDFSEPSLQLDQRAYCGGINPDTLMAKLGPARIGGSGPPKDDVRPG